ncbi:MAG: HAMP domain-containing histidine kinase [Clostridia bacterium]|nr:HAMP domain-containing histidine kinase [Clostridia bacterium]
MKIAVITRRWMVKTFSFITLFLIIIAVALFFAVRSFYYHTAETMVSSGNSSIVNMFFKLTSGTTDEEFNEAARDYIESFTSKDKISVWVINKYGEVIATSDGFDVPQDIQMQDYVDALTSESGFGEWTGEIQSGEKIMAKTYLLSRNENGNAAAIRYSISLQDVDESLKNLLLIMIFVCILMMAITIIPGAVYIEKIVRSINNTTEVANKIAKGEFEERLTGYSTNDEMGELCEAVNNMAGEISTTDRMKNDFISTVSHELRTPLTAIKGWGETIMRIGGSDEVLTAKGMEVIIHETMRLSKMVEDLLDFSRMQSGRMSLRIVRTDILAELDEAILTFRERATREGKVLLYSVPDAPAPMDADPDKIMQVFVNIIDNAIKYTAKGGTIRVDAQIEDDHSRLWISVKDTGRGIPNDDLPKIKEKFYKADSSERGSGIGLAVADEIISMHNGELYIDSMFGVGTTVTVSLPLLANKSENERSASDEQKAKE